MSAAATIHATPRELSLWIDGELSPDRTERVEAHVDQCDECRERYLSTLRLVEDLRGLERMAPPSTLGMVVERHRLEVGNRKLRQRLERSWRRWPDPVILTYLAVVVALGVMAVLVSRVDVPDAGTVIRAPSEAPARIEAAPRARESSHEYDATAWVEPGIGQDEAAAATPATADQVAAIQRRLGAGLPAGTRVVIARVGDAVVRFEIGGEDSRAPQAVPSSGE